MRRLHRNDYHAGIQAEYASQTGTGDAPIGPRRGGLLLQIEQQRPGPVHFDLRDQPLERLAVFWTSTLALATASSVPANVPRAC